MNFSEILKHLGKRGFVTRKIWKKKVAIFFGLDNMAYSVFSDPSGLKTARWTPHLSEIKAKDWIIINDFWGGILDDFKIFCGDEIKKELYNGQKTKKTHKIV